MRLALAIAWLTREPRTSRREALSWVLDAAARELDYMREVAESERASSDYRERLESCTRLEEAITLLRREAGD